MNYKDLIVWRKSMDLVSRIYVLGCGFPRSERSGLWGQITRAAVSIPSNLAEGSGRATPSEFARFVAIARGSLYELSTQLEIAERLGYCKVDDELLTMINEIAKMLTKMMSRRRPGEPANNRIKE